MRLPSLRTAIVSLGVSGLVVVSAATLPLAVQGCGSDSATAVDSTPALADPTSNVILPTYKAIDTTAAALVTAAQALKDAPSAATLTAAQSAWREARKQWSYAEAFRFGPVTSLNVDKSINYWPARGTTIDGYVTGQGALDQASFDALGSNAKGYHAIAYVLFDSSNGDAAVLTKLTTDASAARRLSYLVLATQHVQANTAKLYAAWDPASGNFAREVAQAGKGSVLFPSGKAAFDQMLNSSIFALDLVTGTKLGKPSGKLSGKPAPDLEESPGSDNSINDMIETLDGVKAAYTGAYGGADGQGMQDLVRAKSPALDDTFLTELANARAKILAIPPPFRTAIVTPASQPAVAEAYEACRVMKRAIQSDIADAMGTKLVFNDNDGD